MARVGACVRRRGYAAALAVLGVLVAPGGFVAPAPAHAAAARDPASTVRRTTLIVHDIEASIRFYRDILGFEVWLDNRGTVGPQSLPVDVPQGAPSRFAIMKGRHPWVGMVGLLQYGAARALPPARASRVPGDAILMIETHDVAGIHARMLQAGTRIHRAPETVEVTGAGGAKWQATFLFAYDPDGHLLELNERVPAVAVVGASAPEPAAVAPGAAPRARVTRGYARVRTGQLHFHRADPVVPAGLRPPVVLLHQSPLSGRMYGELLPELGADRIVYALDTPGFGESDPPPAPPPLGDYAEALHDFVAELKEPVDLFGYHTGAMIAVELARRHPGSVRRLVLMSVPLLSAERRAALGTETPISEDGSHLAESWKSSMRARPAGQTLEQVERVVAEKQRAGRRAGWALAAIGAYDAEPALRALTVPTTVIRPKDALFEPSAAAAALIPGARLIDTPQWEHGLFDAHPVEVARLLRDVLDAPSAKP